MIGAGKYDEECTIVREKTNASGVILLVMNGDRGAGFSCQGDLGSMAVMADLLENVAKQMRMDVMVAHLLGHPTNQPNQE